jgi:hypothetical protein
MERLDIVHGHGHSQVLMRRIWEDEHFCEPIGAADKQQAKQCPNDGL